jgi:hypothetical protein
MPPQDPKRGSKASGPKAVLLRLAQQQPHAIGCRLGDFAAPDQKELSDAFAAVQQQLGETGGISSSTMAESLKKVLHCPALMQDLQLRHQQQQTAPPAGAAIEVTTAYVAATVQWTAFAAQQGSLKAAANNTGAAAPLPGGAQPPRAAR